jgi:hypothetical protein
MPSSRQRRYTAPGDQRESAETVTVTLPVHPLAGNVLPVIRWFRSGDDQRYVDVRHPDGHVFRLPLDHTDRGAPVPAVTALRSAHASVAGLLKLAAAVAAAQAAERKLDGDAGRSGTGSRPEQTLRYRLACAPAQCSAEDTASGGTAEQRVPGRRGDADPQALVPGSQEREGCP